MWPLLLAAGGLLSAKGALDEGDAAAADAQETAAQLRENAGQAEAAGQHAGEEELRKAELTMSRMLAVAAASGASAVDPTVVKLASGVAAEGELNAGMQRFNAESQARGMRLQADAGIRRGKAIQRASQWKAAGSLLSAGYQAFGGKK